MEIVYKNIFKDRVNFQIYTLARLWSTWILITFYLLFITLTDLSDLLNPTVHISSRLISFALDIGTWSFVWLLVVGIFSLLMIPRKDKGVLTEHTITLSESGLTEKTQVNRTEATWFGIYNVCQSRNYIFIYTGKHAGHFIPKRAFRTNDESQEFFRFALNQWKKAQTQE